LYHLYVYKKIAALVEDAKKYKESEYADNGLTKSITYDISPKKSEWKEKGDGLYRSADKFVRTKSGTVKDVKYTITGAPSGLTVGEIKTDASEIDDEKDLKKYDICVAQTDASKASSNFYLYCNAEALAKIQAEKATIKVKAKAYSDEKGGRKWTPTVVSQQKITFLEEFTDVKTDEATVKVTAGDFKQGYFSLKKTDKFTHDPVPGAKYYLYEDKDCEDLFCKLAKTSDVGLAQSTTELLTQDTYYLKEVIEADGYQRDETVYEIPLKYFTIVDAAGKVTQKGEVFPVDELPEPVSVAVNKKDTESGNIVKGAGFAVFYDAACTKRVTEDGTDGGTEVPVFYYDEDTELAVSAKFAHTQETYYVKEVVIPDPYKDNGKVIPVKPDNGAMEEVSMDNTPARYGVDAVKEDAETKEPQGDATLEGATYGLYAAENIQYPDGRGIVTYKDSDNITSTKGTEFQSTGAAANKDALLATVKTDAEGKFNFANLYYGNYYIREISESEGYLLDGTVYPVNFKEEEKHKDITVQRTVKETVKKQPFEIIKVSTDGDETETDYVKDAGFTVKLLSETDRVGWDAAKTYDTLVTDEKGYAVSKELPYGTYLVRETKVPKDLYKTDDFTVQITEDSREPQKYRILNDAPFKAYIRFIKKDAETGETILLSGVTFKIRKAGTEDYVSQKVGDKQVTEFVTDETGTVTTPLRLKYGDYECVEITAPEGYLVSEEAFPFSVHMGEDGENVIKVEEDLDGDPVIAVELENEQVKGSITVHKQGEMLSSIGYDSIIDRILDFIGGEDRTIHFNYEKRDLSGAEFQVIAAEDIYTPDNQKDSDGNRVLAVVNDVPATEGAVLATLTTDFEGKATLEDLPLGKYKVVEIKAPAGFVVDPEAKEVELKYKDQDTEVVYGEAEFEDIRIKPELSLVKTDSVTKKPVAGAVYGLYAAEDIYIESGIVKSEVSAQPEVTAENASGTETGMEVKAGAETDAGEDPDTEDNAENGGDTEDSSDGSEETEDSSDAENGTEVTAVPASGTMEEPQATADVVSGPAIALSSAISVAVKADELIATAVTDEDGNAKFDVDLPLGKYYVKEIEAPAGYLKDENSYPADFSFRPEMGTKEELTLEMEDTPIIVEVSKKDATTGKEIRGAKLEITDDKGKTYASWTTDGKPYRLEAMPAGKYTLKETFAPYGYMIANEVEFTVEETGEIQKVEMVDERVKGFIEIYKICSETKKPIEGVSFELQNKEGKVLAVLKTDKKGYAKTELLDICTYKKDGSYDKDIPYYIVESKTAKGYILDRTKHEVFLQYDDSATEPVGYALTVKNKPDHPLPQTGGDYRPWLFALGGALLAGAGVVIYRRRRRRIVG
jgi:LPXTG-motif cell wall-anchored protein